MNQTKLFPLRCVVIEDEPEVCQWICDSLSKFPEVEVVGSCGEVDDSFDLITQTKPDGIFLDIELLGGGSGFTLIDRLRKSLTVMPPIAVLTGNIEYAPEVVNKYSGVITQFLVKPYVRDIKLKLQACLDSFAERKKAASSVFLFKTEGGVRRFQLDELHYLEVVPSGRTKFFTATGSFTVDLTLIKALELLPASIVQCNRNNAINLRKVIFMDLQTAKLLIDGKEMTLKITDTFVDSARQSFLQMG
jgi:response regulator of citrate/malate metabolism